MWRRRRRRGELGGHRGVHDRQRRGDERRRLGGGSASGGETGSASGIEAATCSPVGTDLEAAADETVEVTLREYEFAPSTVEVAAGTVTFVADNAGTENHELAFLPAAATCR